MLKTILIGLDGSPYAEAAVQLGLRWAQQFDCQLAGVAVIDEYTIRRPQTTPVGGGAFKQQADEVRMAEARRRCDRMLERFALSCAEASVASKLLEDVGRPYEEILVEAQRYDLIMVGQRSQFRFESSHGDPETVEALLRRTPRPVVVVPKELPTAGDILVAFDGSLNAARALQSFLSSGLTALGKIHLLTIDKRSSVEAARIAERAVDFLGFHSTSVTPHYVTSSEAPGQLILDKMNELPVELVVMGCYGLSKLREFFLGSVTRSVLDKTTVPLFLYH